MRVGLFRFCLLLLFTLGGCKSLTLFTDTIVLIDDHFGQLWRHSPLPIQHRDRRDA